MMDPVQEREIIKMKRTHLISFNNRDCHSIQELAKDDHKHSHCKDYSPKGIYHLHEETLITWPPKNYTCSFCRREFRSAQALGGHMNVHRRDRAKLRQLPSWLLADFSTPNPNFPSSPSSSSNFLTPHASFYNPDPTQNQNIPPSRIGLSNPTKLYNPCISEFKNTRGKCNLLAARDEKKKGGGDVISLELEMGLKDPKQVLDLELRLGHFN